MNAEYSSAVKTVLAAAGELRPDTAVILGSGLGGFSHRIENAVTVPYSDLEGFPVSTAPGHEGKLYIGKIAGKAVYCLSGRSHYYEGRSASEITFAIRTLFLCGVKKLIVTNAAGGVNTGFNVGDLMLICDHVSFLPNPLIGKNDDSFGPRFPDMTYAYSPELRSAARAVAEGIEITLREGVYFALTGPSYETPAEICAYRQLGADAVGMSTVPEVIVANHCGMKALGISLITNMAAGVLENKLSGAEVVEAANKAAPYFEALVGGIIGRIGE